VFLSLQKEGYNIPVIGFSWDSDTAFSLTNVAISQRGWDIAKLIANENGPILAKFIDSFKDECQESKLRIIAHSLGSRVTLSAI
jgi:esterase/lipase superfamily enzyme